MNPFPGGTTRMRRILRGKALLAAIAAAALSGAAWAGEGCIHGSEAAKVDGAMGEHCSLMNGVTKDARITSDGAVVTLHGKNPEAVKHIQEHLGAHLKGEGCPPCPQCPLGMKDVTTKIEMTKDGGTITTVAKTPGALKTLKDWANSKGGCCGGDHAKKV